MLFPLSMGVVTVSFIYGRSCCFRGSVEELWVLVEFTEEYQSVSQHSVIRSSKPPPLLTRWFSHPTLLKSLFTHPLIQTSSTPLLTLPLIQTSSTPLLTHPLIQHAYTPYPHIRSFNTPTLLTHSSKIPRLLTRYFSDPTLLQSLLTHPLIQTSFNPLLTHPLIQTSFTITHSSAHPNLLQSLLTHPNRTSFHPFHYIQSSKPSFTLTHPIYP